MAGMVLNAQVIPGRFIVELAGEPLSVFTAKAGVTRLAAGERRTQIEAEQQAGRAVVGQRGGRVLMATDAILNALIVEGSDEAQLRSIPGVIHVYPVRQVKAALNRALPISKVVEAWAAIGGVEKAGLGIKIGILDTGVDNEHPWLKDPDLPLLEGFPKASKEANLAYTSRKVIVARSYEALSPEGYGGDARDRHSHGTSAAAAAAGLPFVFQGLQISGVAPKAYLGNYKVLGDSGGGSDDAILKAIDDAVKDGMDVLNMSLGSDMAADPAEDAQYKAIEAACKAGLIVVVAAGNAGPDENTMNSPGTAPCAITVGSSSSDRAFEEFPLSKEIDPKRVSEFSSRGPNVGPALKPDLLAVGDNFLTAESTVKANSNGFTITQGTSFATPLVAGAAAVLRGAVKGRTVDQYRSNLINTAAPLVSASGELFPVRFTGAGVLDLDAAVRTRMAVMPTSVQLGVGSANPDIAVRLQVYNLAAASETFTLSIESSNAVVPRLSVTSLVIPADQSLELMIRFTGTDLAAGEYQGRIRIKSGSGGNDLMIPYWYAAASREPARITVLSAPQEGPAGGQVQFGVRVLDGSGVAIDVKPDVEFGPGGGTGIGVDSLAPQIPGIYLVRVKLGPEPGENLFRLSAGKVARVVSIVAR